MVTNGRRLSRFIAAKPLFHNVRYPGNFPIRCVPSGLRVPTRAAPGLTAAVLRLHALVPGRHLEHAVVQGLDLELPDFHGE